MKINYDFNNAKRGGFIYSATLLLFLAVSLIGQIALELAMSKGTVFFAVNSLFSVFAFAVSITVYSKNNVKILNLHKCSYVYVLPVFALALGMLLGLGFLNSVVADGVKSVGGNISDVNIPLETPFQYVLFSVILCVLPAVAEELFFRGVLLDSLSETGNIPRVVAVALCFALYHGNAAQLAYQFVYGVGLCVLTLKAKSVIPAIFAHFINNFAVLSLEYFKMPVDLFNPFVIAAGIAWLSFFALFMVFYRKEGIRKRIGRMSIKDFYLPFGIFGIFF